MAHAAEMLEARGLLKRSRADHSERIIEHVGAQLGGRIPADLEEFYRERIEMIGDYFCISPEWNDYVDWRPLAIEMTRLLPVSAVPVALDGFGTYLVWISVTMTKYLVSTFSTLSTGTKRRSMQPAHL